MSREWEIVNGGYADMHRYGYELLIKCYQLSASAKNEIQILAFQFTDKNYLMKHRIFKEFETVDLIPYSIAVLMMGGNIWFIVQFVDTLKQISG